MCGCRPFTSHCYVRIPNSPKASMVSLSTSSVMHCSICQQYAICGLLLCTWNYEQWKQLIHQLFYKMNTSWACFSFSLIKLGSDIISPRHNYSLNCTYLSVCHMPISPYIHTFTSLDMPKLCHLQLHVTKLE
jgi:hypothetical protein